MKSWPRDVLLAACPHLSCSRRKQCFLLAQGGHCVKTHYSSADEWRDEITARLIAVEQSDEPEDPEMVAATPDERAAMFYEAFKERARELGLKV
jgi:hypothetical protein